MSSRNEQTQSSTIKNETYKRHSHTISFQSILRIRPLSNKESKDESESIVLTLSDERKDMIHLCNSPNEKSHTTSLSRITNKCKSPREESPYHQYNVAQQGPRQQVSSFRFDSVFNTSSSQKDIHDSYGACMVTDVVQPLKSFIAKKSITRGLNQKNNTTSDEVKHHVLISMGPSNSGKTYSILGPNHMNNEPKKYKNHAIDSSKKSDLRGILPRILEDLFLHERIIFGMGGNEGKSYEDGACKFVVKISMIYVYKDNVYDMLTKCEAVDNSVESKMNRMRSSNVRRVAASFEQSALYHNASQMKELKVSQNRSTLDFEILPTTTICHNEDEALSTLASGLKFNKLSATGTNSSSSRGHTIINIQPVLISRGKSNQETKFSNETVMSDGGKITIVDMAGIERTKQSNVYGHTMKESVAINATIFSTLQCLRSIKQNFSLTSSSDNTTPRKLPVKDYTTKDELENKCPNKNTNSNNEIDLNDKKSNRDKLLPFRRNKLTMLLQPLFSGKINDSPTLDRSTETQTLIGNKSSTTVTLLISVYPGKKDQYEKKFLLSEIDKIRGLKLKSNHSTHVSNYDSSRKRQGKLLFNPDTYSHSQQTDPMRLASENSEDNCKRVSKQGIVIKKQTKSQRENSLGNSALNFETDADKKQYPHKISELEIQLSKIKEEKINLEKKYDILENENKTLRMKLEKEINLKRKHCETCSAYGESNDKIRKRTSSQLIPDVLFKHIKDVEKSHSIYESMYPKGEQAGATLRLMFSDKKDVIRTQNDASALELLEKLEQHIK